MDYFKFFPSWLFYGLLAANFLIPTLIFAYTTSQEFTKKQKRKKIAKGFKKYKGWIILAFFLTIITCLIIGFILSLMNENSSLRDSVVHKDEIINNDKDSISDLNTRLKYENDIAILTENNNHLQQSFLDAKKEFSTKLANALREAEDKSSKAQAEAISNVRAELEKEYKGIINGMGVKGRRALDSVARTVIDSIKSNYDIKPSKITNSTIHAWKVDRATREKIAGNPHRDKTALHGYQVVDVSVNFTLNRNPDKKKDTYIITLYNNDIEVISKRPTFNNKQTNVSHNNFPIIRGTIIGGEISAIITNRNDTIDIVRMSIPE